MHSIYEMEALLRATTQLFDNCCVVSCYPAAEELPDNPSWLRMFFADLLCSEEELAEIAASVGPELRKNIFNEGHAEQILDFLVMHHARPEPLSLLVNCEIGVSRSGAVATLAKQMVGIPDDDFARENPKCVPNRQILKTLRLVAERRGLIAKTV